MNGVDTNNGQDDGEIGHALLGLESSVKGNDNRVGGGYDGHGGHDERHTPEETIRDLSKDDSGGGSGNVGRGRGKLGNGGTETHGLGDGWESELDT